VRKIEQFAATLKDKELEIFRTRLLAEGPPTLQEVGARFGISRERVRQIESRLKRRLKEFLKDQAGDRRKVFVVGEGALVHSLYEAGFVFSEHDADFVVLGETTSYNFEMIQKAARLVRDGARFIATNPDVAGPKGRPACGALAAPIERITGKQPFYVGKPNPVMMRAALRYLKVHSEDAWMIGDNMETDIIAGIQTGMRTILVLSGVSQREDLTRYAYRPHHVVDEVSGILPLLAQLGA